MLEHNILDASSYHIQTLKDNVGLLTPELLENINQVIVEAGHLVLKKKKKKFCMGGAIPLSLKLMCITQQILIYY